jgi:hypothetical protein
MHDRRPPLRVVLELDRGSQPVRAQITTPEYAARRCVGWLALIGALESLREPEASWDESTAPPPRERAT